MAGPSASRLARAGGDRQAALAGLFDPADADQARQNALAKKQFANDPAGLEAWYDRELGQTTKGKYSGVLGKAVKTISSVAPYVLPLIPGIGPLAAGALSAGAGFIGGKNVKQSLTQGVLSGAGSALLGGQGYKGVGGVVGRAKNLALGKVGATGTRAGGLIGKGGLLSKASSTVGGPLNLAQLGLAGVNAYEGAKAGGQADAARTRALGALPGDDSLERQNLDSLFADPANPYAGGARPRRSARAANAALAGSY